MNQINKVAHSLDAVLGYTSRVLNIIGVTSLVAMMLLTVSDVFLRYFFAQPIKGSVELTEYFMAVVGFCGLAWCAVKVGHARVDLLIARFSPRTQAVFDSVTYFLALTVAPLVAWRGIAASNYAREVGKYSVMLEIPAYPFYLALGIGFLVLSLVLVAHMVRSIVKVVQG